MPPEPLSWDRKDAFKERKHQRSESLGPVVIWKDAPLHAPPRGNFSSLWPSAEFCRPHHPGHGKQGNWHVFTDDCGHGYASSRSSGKMLDNEGFRPAFSREGRYGRNDRDYRGLYNQRDYRGNSWETSSLSPHTPGTPNDLNNDQRPQDGNMTYSSNPQSDFVSTLDQIQSKDHVDKVGGCNGLGVSQKCDRDNSLGSMDWRSLKWSRSGSINSHGSGFSHSGSSKSMGGVDSSEAKNESQKKNVTPLQSPSGDATACVTSETPSEETSSRKKPRLGWGEGLAKYEKKKVDPADVIMNKDGDVCPVGNVEPVQSASPHVADKSPRLTVLTDCASPATPSSVACSSSPGVEDKLFGKTAGADNDTNLNRSPGTEFQSHQEGFSYKLEMLDYNSLASVRSSLHELLLSDDPSPMDSSTGRPTTMNKLLIWKGDISKVLEVTESEIDSLENELKLLNSDSTDTCHCPAASSSLPVEGSDKSCEEQATAINLVSRPAPLVICSSGNADVDKLAIANGEHGESCGFKDQDMDSPGTVTSKFVDQLPLNVASSDIVNSGGGAENQDLVETVKREVECLASGEDEEKGDPSVRGNSRSEMVTPVSDDLGLCAGVADHLCDLIYSSNKESASEASDDIFNTPLPNFKCKNVIPGVGISSSWKNDSLLRKMFKARKKHVRFMERYITLKYKAHQQLWKEDVRLLSARKYQPKYKKYDLGLRNPSNGYQKHRSSIRSRVSKPAGNLSLAPTKEVEKFANKVLCDSQVKLYRYSLKMPALILDKEKTVTKLVCGSGLIEDPCAVEKEKVLINPWTPEETETFIEKLTVFGKDFRKIASFFDHKTTADCVELYYKHHKSAAFQKAKKKPDMSKLGQSSANTYLINPGMKWNREVNAASLDILGAASVMSAQADGSTRNRTGRLTLRGYKNMKASLGDDVTLERTCNFDVIQDDREAAAADVLAGICGSLSSEAVSSCITISIDPAEGCRQRKGQKVDSIARRPLTLDVLPSVDDETCSDDSCGEVDPSDWTDEEKSSFIQAVSSFGKDFAMISRCVRTRSQNQCRVFFSKTRKCLGLDLVNPLCGNEGASMVDDANGGEESDTEDACVLETVSGISSDKSGCDMNEDLPSSVMDLDPEKTMNLQCDPLGSVENNAKSQIDHLGKKDLKSSDALQIEDRTKLVFDDLTNIMDTNVRLSEPVPAQRSESFSAVAGAVTENVTEKGNLVAESVVGEGMCSDVPQSEGHDEKCNTDTSLQVSVHDCNSSGRASEMAAEGSCSGLAAECLQQVSVKFNSIQKSLANSLNGLAAAISMPENRTLVQCGKIIDQDNVSSTLSNLEDRDKQSPSIRGDDVHKHLPGLPVLRSVDPAHVLNGYPLQMAMGKDINGQISCDNLIHFPKPDGDLSGHVPKDWILQFGNCKPQSSQVEFPLVHQKIERRPDTTKAHSWSSSDTVEPSRNGDVKLFGKILTSIHGDEEKGSHIPNLSNKSSILNFSGDHNLSGNSGVLKFDSRNFAGIDIVQRRNNSFWEGNKVQNGHQSFPDSAILLAKYPGAFGNFPTSSSKSEQQPLAVVRNNDGPVNGASVFPSREISSSSGGSGTVDYRQIFSRHRGGPKAPLHTVDAKQRQAPVHTVDAKQRQDSFDVSRRNGFDSVSSLQQQGKVVVGVNGMNVVGRAGIMVGGPCTGVSDPVAAIRMHYAKTEQFGPQGIIREEEAWRGKGDVGR